MPPPLKLRLAQFTAKHFGVGIIRGYSIGLFLEDFQAGPRASLQHYLTPQYFSRQELIYALELTGRSCQHKNELEVDLADLFVESERQLEELSILSFHGIAASDTSDRKSFRDLALRLEANLRRGPSRNVHFETDADFATNQEDYKRKHGGSPVKAQRQDWNGRLDMKNGDGSHHLAGVLRQCLDQGRDAFFSCQVETMRVNAATVERMLRRWHLFMASDRTVDEFRVSLDYESEQSKRHLRYAGQVQGIAVKFGLIGSRSRKDADLTILAVPRSWKHGDKVRAALLAPHQRERFFDLSDYLLQLVDAQRQGSKDEPQPRGEQSSTGYRHPRGKDFPLA